MSGFMRLITIIMGLLLFAGCRPNPIPPTPTPNPTPAPYSPTDGHWRAIIATEAAYAADNQAAPQPDPKPTPEPTPDNGARPGYQSLPPLPVPNYFNPAATAPNTPDAASAAATVPAANGACAGGVCPAPAQPRLFRPILRRRR